MRYSPRKPHEAERLGVIGDFTAMQAKKNAPASFFE
jgi:hypothetical protein